MMRTWEPSSNQRLLLHACLAQSSETEYFLRKWESLQPWEDLDYGSLRLLPYLYRKLESEDIESKYGDRLKGTYARFWYLHNLEIKPTLEILKEMQTLRYDFLLLKGIALQHLVYRDDPPMRPGIDIDVLIKLDQVRDWDSELTSRGFVSDSDYSLEYSMKYKKSAGYSRGRNNIDLNWRINEFSADPDIEVRMFSRRKEIEISGDPFSTLSPTDHLLHTILHGSPWNPVSPIRWVLDSVLLISSQKIDWEVFVNEIIRCNWQRPSLWQLEYLSQEFEVSIPHEVFESLRKRNIRTAGLLMSVYSEIPTRRARRVTRALYAELLNDRRRASKVLWWLGWPVNNIFVVRDMFKEYVRTRQNK